MELPSLHGLSGLKGSSSETPVMAPQGREAIAWHVLLLFPCPSPTFSPHSSYCLPPPGSPPLFATPELHFVFFKFLSIL